MLGEGGIHTIPVGLAKGTRGIGLPNGVAMLRDNLLGLGLLAGARDLGDLGLSRVHTAVGGTHQSTITARRTLTCHPLARGLAGGTEGGDFLAKQSNFGEELVHWGFEEMIVWGEAGSDLGGPFMI